MPDIDEIQKNEDSSLALSSNYTEIYECELLSGRLILLAQNEEILQPILYSGQIRQDIAQMAKTGIHPDDISAYRELYDTDHILSKLQGGAREILGEYRRKGKEGAFHWVAATIIPAEKWTEENRRVIIMIKDVTAHHMRAEQEIRMQRRSHFIFQKSCDAVTEVDIETGRYLFSPVAEEERFNAIARQGDFDALLDFIVERYLDDTEENNLKQTLCLKSLRDAVKRKEKEVNCQCHVREKADAGAREAWVEFRVFFLYEEQPVSAFVTARDITCQKKEEEKKYIRQQYDIALRSIYDELYELNVTQNCYKIVYHVPDKYVTPPEKGNLDEGIQQVSQEMVHPDDKERFLQFFDLASIRKTFAFGKESMIGEFRKLWTDGAYHWASLTLFPVEKERRGDELYLCFVMDITDKKKADKIQEQNRTLRQQQLNDERYKIIVEQTNTMVFEWNRKTGERFIPERIKQEIEGQYDNRDILKVWLEDDVLFEEDRESVRAEMKKMLAGNSYFEMLIRLKRREGGYTWFKMSQTAIMDQNGELYRIIGTLNDVDEITRSQETLKYKAEFDTLTGIYNVETFYAYAQQMMRENPDKKYAVIRLDINRFKYINDLFGIEQGDKILRYIAGILQDITVKNGVCGRVGGDIFCICMAYESAVELNKVAAAIAKKISQYHLGYRITPYFGICRVEDRNIPVSILCDWANLALKTIKGNTLTNVAYYDDELRARQLQERKIEEEMEKALEEKQFEIYFQPKYQIETGEIIGAEALVRWNHPQDGIVMPNSFIPLFESNGFIIRLDEYVWEQTFIMLREWIDKGYQTVPISVNVSRIHIYNSTFLNKLVELTNKYHLPQSLVELELTESTFIENESELYEKMRKLQKEGFRFSMDDFGSGYSSLNMLKSTQVNTIKLDRGFLNEAVTTSKGRTVIQYVIAMAKQLELEVISEGVENREQADFLLSVGCAIAQGYYFSRPVPREEFERKLLLGTEK